MTDKELDFTKPVQTHDGRKVRILCTDKLGNYDKPICGLVTNGLIEDVYSWSEEGKYYGNSFLDLIQIKEKVKIMGYCYYNPILKTQRIRDYKIIDRSINPDWIYLGEIEKEFEVP